MRDALLFNCCTGYAEPDWSAFDCLELAGCRNAGPAGADETETASATAREAEFFTVYGRRPDGEAEAITDIHEPREALNVAARLAVRSCLRCIVSIVLASPELLPSNQSSGATR